MVSMVCDIDISQRTVHNKQKTYDKGVSFDGPFEGYTLNIYVHDKRKHKKRTRHDKS